MSNAASALTFPSSLAPSISLKSLDTPEIPSTPDFLFNILSISDGVKFSFSIKNVITAASTSPARVPITSPSNGVKPIEVSIDLPFLTAQILPPFPK